MSKVKKGRRASAPPVEVERNLIFSYMERNREFYVEEFREAILA